MALVKIRCPVCGGVGCVEEWFGSGTHPDNKDWLMDKKECPVCKGSGIQDVYVNDFMMFPQSYRLDGPIW